MVATKRRLSIPLDNGALALSGVHYRQMAADSHVAGTEMRPLDYGDPVEVSTAAPSRYRPGAKASVYSIYECTSQAHADRTGVPIGEVAIGVEFPDGASIEVPLYWVRPLSFDE